MAHSDREQKKMLARVKKLRGQMEAVERALSTGKECGDILMLLSAVRGALNGLMGQVLEDHIRYHLTEPSNEKIAPELAEDLIDLVHSYLK